MSVSTPQSGLMSDCDMHLCAPVPLEHRHAGVDTNILVFDRSQSAHLTCLAHTYQSTAQVYEKKVTCLTGFNLDGRNGVLAPPSGKVSALNNVPVIQRLTQPLRLPKVCCLHYLLVWVESFVQNRSEPPSSPLPVI